ncbi:MAG: hypothetical protein QOJ69_723 [Actinomycetota bacterium]|nr:hypothetical protein [Actinomycetota bacterium]
MPESHLYGERAAGVEATGADAAVANIVGAVSDHRRRMARLLDSLDALPTEASGMPVATLMRDVSQRLRTGEDRLGALVAQLDGRSSADPFPNKETSAWP